MLSKEENFDWNIEVQKRVGNIKKIIKETL